MVKGKILALLSLVLLLALGAPTCRPQKPREEGKEEAGASPSPPESKPFIALVPFGEVPDEVLTYLERELPKRFLGLPAKRTKPLPIPKNSYNPARKQYRSDHFLIALRRPKGAVKALGIVNLDLYTPPLNFVFGQATLGGIGGVIALPRLRPEFWGEKVGHPQSLFLSRALKEAVHELGHAFGLEHCPNPSCVMHFSNTIWDTDRKKADFCERCRRVVEGRIRKILEAE